MTDVVVTAQYGTPFKDVVRLLGEHRISGLPVIGEDDMVTGVTVPRPPRNVSCVGGGLPNGPAPGPGIAAVMFSTPHPCHRIGAGRPWRTGGSRGVLVLAGGTRWRRGEAADSRAPRNPDPREVDGPSRPVTPWPARWLLKQWRSGAGRFRPRFA
ncbi:CBS domain-containing protein [Streptomyces mirabilis]